MMSKIGRNNSCPCGSGKKHKKCCLDKPQNAHPASTVGRRYEKILDVGTSHPFVARLSVGMFEIVDFTTLPKDQADFIKGKMLEAFQLLLKAEACVKPVADEVNGILHGIEKQGILHDPDGKPILPPPCSELLKSRDFLLQCRAVLDVAFAVMNSLWNATFTRNQFSSIHDFLSKKFGEDHILTKLLKDDYPWLVSLTNHINMAESSDFKVSDYHVSEKGADGKYRVTLPSFSNGDQIAQHLEVYLHNLFTFIEEITALSLAEYLDPRLTVHDIPEMQRSRDVAVRFRVGPKLGVDITQFKDDPRYEKLYRSGQHFFHLREQLREGKFGRVRPIIQMNHNGETLVCVRSTIHTGMWKTFTDFLYDYLKIKFGKEWWLEEVKRPSAICSPVLTWARLLYEHQKQHSRKEGELFNIVPNGPMSAYYSLAYDLFVLEDNQALQASLIERMQDSDKTKFWGARYEAMVAATIIRAGFDIEYEDEADNRTKHPEFVATHRETGEKIDVEAKKRNRTSKPKNDTEVKLEIEGLLRSAVKKFRGNPFIIFLELDLHPIDGDPLKKPWFTELLQSIEGAGTRDADGKDLCNMFVFTNYPTEHPEDISKHPFQTHIVSKSNVPKAGLKNFLHLIEIVSAVEKHQKIPTWFEE